MPPIQLHSGPPERKERARTIPLALLLMLLPTETLACEIIWSDLRFIRLLMVSKASKRK